MTKQYWQNISIYLRVLTFCNMQKPGCPVVHVCCLNNSYSYKYLLGAKVVHCSFNSAVLADRYSVCSEGQHPTPRKKYQISIIINAAPPPPNNFSRLWLMPTLAVWYSGMRIIFTRPQARWWWCAHTPSHLGSGSQGRGRVGSLPSPRLEPWYHPTQTENRHSGYIVNANVKLLRITFLKLI